MITVWNAVILCFNALYLLHSIFNLKQRKREAGEALEHALAAKWADTQEGK